MISSFTRMPDQFKEILDLAKLIFHDRYFELYDRLPTQPGEGDVNFQVMEEYSSDTYTITADVLTPQGVMSAGYKISKADILDQGPSALYIPICSMVNNLGRSIFEREWSNIRTEDIDRFERSSLSTGRVSEHLSEFKPPKRSIRDEVEDALTQDAQFAPVRPEKAEPEIKRSEEFGAW